MELYHEGIKGQKWGVRNGPPYPLSKEQHLRVVSNVSTNYTKANTPSELYEYTRKIKYKKFTQLQSPETTARTKAGSCHDITWLMYSELKRMGYDPRIIFVMELDKSGQGGMTHTLCTYKEGKEVKWFEPANTWPSRSGITAFTSENAIRNAIKRAHDSGEYGNKQIYSHLEFGEFDPSDHEVGEDLQDFVLTCLD